ncbi:NADPH-dependent F420 reductase [Roseisolibacter sp. H3M3-2]|uniref:NADPH-dependent F420 reductase n=1 Tax=Roseisolibacter sp. H3M3-2 TaxID=3031323 RepID=UPI0023D97916|nr:NADPH-dependent F420 reductase [Roseisolibacter sp. H3M3-2]MDF1502275.1 NADPH-dependent F420 reductase [Roseisolibacter sp. H3M3-2]
MARTRIGIIGAGNMGSAFAKRLAAAGHDVTITAKDPAHAEQAAQQAAAAGGSVRAVPRDQIARDADVLIVATYFPDAPDALRAAGDLTGKTVIDISNPLTPDMSGLSLGHTTSAAEELQKAVPNARVVKAFNTVFAQVLGGTGRAQVLYAGDDASAKDAVRALIESAGFEAVDAGPLANARQLEPLGLLNIYFGYVAGRGTGIAPAFVAVA